MQTQRKPSSVNSNDSNNSVNDVSDEQLRTLWCGNISDKVDEEVLYELFLNAGPLQKVFIPKDRETKKQKNFAFITFEHVESVKYAFNLLNGTELYRQSIKLQNKETGLGMGPSHHQFNSHRDGGHGGRGHHRAASTPVGGVKFQYPQSPQQKFQPPVPPHQMSPQSPVWNNGYGYPGGNNQYQAYGYNNYNMDMGGYNNGANQSQYNNQGWNDFSRDERSRNRDREFRGGRDQRDGGDRNYSRDREDRRDFSRDRDDRRNDRHRNRR